MLLLVCVVIVSLLTKQKRILMLGLFCFRGELSDDEDSVKELNGLGKKL